MSRDQQKRLYAHGTSVSVGASRAEIERLLERYGAAGFAYASEPGKAAIVFRAHERMVRFQLEIPTKVKDVPRLGGARRARTLGGETAMIEAEARRRWRCLVLAIKAKLEVVESGIETFEQAFMANLLLADGRTLAEETLPRLAAHYETGKPLALPGLEARKP